MGEPKPIASLSSTLLARKGQAKPAMRPQGFASFGFGGPQSYEDLGWNDMGTDHAVPHHAAHVQSDHVQADIVSLVPPAPPAEPVAIIELPAVVRQQAALAREMATPVAPVAVEPVVAQTQYPVAPRERAAAGSKAKAAFTLRLDPDRHLRLRLVCAVSHRSAQSVVIEALDALLSARAEEVAAAQSRTVVAR